MALAVSIDSSFMVFYSTVKKAPLGKEAPDEVKSRSQYGLSVFRSGGSDLLLDG
jgi:hypothetical protein